MLSDDKIIYILIIDTSIKQQKANVQLLQNLNLLAYDSSSIYKKIDDVTGSHLQESLLSKLR